MELKYKTETVRIFTEIIRCVVLSQPLNTDLFAQADWQEIYKLSKAHDLENLLQYTITKLPEKLLPPPNMLRIIYESFSMAVARDTMQSAELKKIETALSVNKVSYVLFKGCVVKNLYPSPDMRQMNDIDMYINPKEQERARAIFKKLGYETADNGEVHIVFHKKPIMNVEMHCGSLIDSESPMFKYFENVSTKTQADKNMPYHFELTAENHYLYLAAHLYHHFKAGGIGLRALLDVYLFTKKYENVSQSPLVKKVLKDTGMSVFAASVQKYAKFFFEDDVSKLDNVACFYINSGSFGECNGIAVKAINDRNVPTNKIKVKYVIEKIFPKYSFMKKNSKTLEKIPVLLPAYYIKYWCDRMFVKKNINIDRVKKNIKTLDSTKEDMSEVFNSCGVR